MELVPNSVEDRLVFALGLEETLVLLQPREMLRRCLDANPVAAEQARFLFAPETGPGLLLVLPRSLASAILLAPAGHAVERELKEWLLTQITATERPRIAAVVPVS